MKNNCQLIPRSFAFSVAVFICLSITHCVNLGQPQGLGPTGILYASYSLGLSERNLPKLPLKKGKACVKRYGFLFTSGDASISEAANASGIVDIYRIEKEATNYLSLYSSLCTVVWGI
ncbi:TRL-like family protein [Leptospira sp. 2 VSF19]|uniref:TRL-like family protein n=1 Tax=Leptospira soteropolitanensis TaxID=2950025 RepID=A0AAW5VHH4_9LEPT|nr:TRL domain-containing protein [Leptospira soteropolitanensis]MCW7491491.1 TRL-like family protein [Leptospira soteropolitanensis]MCW7499075.1 TRL-like family protein [Leptospira soteropolitanensis]MCW7521333.1 TRL-like family protein [Leptospira soteropolitanensis]MCW7525179.1 TRL-like family protein [Leptospira soteropolitanensis]MCW7529046.1 TRL-like family protein [Leptospira soteropolitanensis]